MALESTETGPKPNKRNTQHGLSLMKRALKAGGMKTLDRRTSISKALDQWRDQLIADLGGSEQVSTQQLAVVTLAVRTKLLLDSIDNWLLQQASLINSRKRSVLPAVLQRQTLADALARYLVQLGLERKVKQIPSLQNYLKSKQPEGAA